MLTALSPRPTALGGARAGRRRASGPPPFSAIGELAAYWRFDAVTGGQVADLKGNSPVTIETNSGTSLVAGGRIGDTALQFTGSGSGRVYATPVGLNATTTGGRTLVIWFKKTTAPSGDQLLFWTRWGTEFAENGTAFRNDGLGKILLARHPHYAAFPGVAPISLNVWHMFALVKRPNGALGGKFYVDGVLLYDSQYKENDPGFGVYFGGSLYLCSLYDGQFRMGGIHIDEAGTFNFEMTSEQVAELHAIGAAGAPFYTPP